MDSFLSMPSFQAHLGLFYEIGNTLSSLMEKKMQFCMFNQFLGHNFRDFKMLNLTLNSMNVTLM